MTSCAISNDDVILALCCAEERMHIVLGSPASLLFAEEIHCPGQSIQHVHETIRRALSLHDIRVKDLAGIACVRGPGSFTGLRIGHAAMYGLALPFATPMAGLLYHSLLAAQVQPVSETETWVLTYARKQHVYVQSYRNGEPMDTIRPMPVASLVPILTNRPQPPLILGSGVRKNPEILEYSGLRILPRHFDTPAPLTLLDAACSATFTPTSPVPLYLRKSDAEDNLAAIATSRGISETLARSELHEYE